MCHSICQPKILEAEEQSANPPSGVGLDHQSLTCKEYKLYFFNEDYVKCIFTAIWASSSVHQRKCSTFQSNIYHVLFVIDFHFLLFSYCNIWWGVQVSWNFGHYSWFWSLCFQCVHQSDHVRILLFHLYILLWNKKWKINYKNKPPLLWNAIVLWVQTCVF